MCGNNLQSIKHASQAAVAKYSSGNRNTIVSFIPGTRLLTRSKTYSDSTALQVSHDYSHTYCINIFGCVVIDVVYITSMTKIVTCLWTRVGYRCNEVLFVICVHSRLL